MFKKLQYQAHIDGLRAIAVLSVVFYHLNLSVFGGGFVGVDIFFVISGFLISSIIWDELEVKGKFSYKRFYTRRARRLLPSFFTTLIISSLIALSLYSSERLFEFGKEVVYTTLSGSNFLFWQQAGYFDGAASTKTLLHMWSLSLEEQFYFFWPLTLVIFHKLFSKQTGINLIITLLLLSFFSNIYLTQNEIDWIPNQSQAMFYLMPSRAHEFMLGSLGYYLLRHTPANKWFQECMFLFGLFAILWSITQFNSSTLFPYYNALIPSIGSLAIILSNGSILNQLLFGNRVMVFIGLISYTLYLVHWPTIVFLQHWKFDDLQPQDILLALAIMSTLSIAIYFAIEKPLRYKNTGNHEHIDTRPTQPSYFWKGCIICLVFMLTLGSVLITTSGLGKYKSELFTNYQINLGKSKRFSKTSSACQIDNLDSISCDKKRPLQVLVYGNSHEPDGYNIFERIAAKNNNSNIISFGTNNKCNIEINSTGAISSKIKKHNCSNRTAVLNNKQFVNSLDAIVYSSNKPFAANKKTSWKILNQLSKVNPRIKLIVIGTYVNTQKPCAELANRSGSTNACLASINTSYVGLGEGESKFMTKITESQDFIYFDKFSALCENRQDIESCLSRTETEPMFYDQHHLSLSFAQLIGDKFSLIYSMELQSIGF